VQLWTAGTGLVHGDRPVLETLAATYTGEEVRAERLPDLPLIWLTQNPHSLNTLPPGSRWMLWPTATSETEMLTTLTVPGLVVQPDKDLQTQLQSAGELR
jgi:hypothetical protein